MGLCDFLGGGNNTPSKPKYNWKPKSTKTSKGTFTKEQDYKNVMHDFKRMPSKVKEYQTPAAMFNSGTVKNFGYRGSEEGVHVGSRSKFNGTERRRIYKKTTVTFDGVYCDFYGEDCFTVDPLGKAIIRKGQFKGRYDRGSDGNKPGQDKCIQCDGGRLEVKANSKGSVLFDNCVQAIRAKANSIVIIDGANFVDSKNCIRGDGDANPTSIRSFFNGRKGKCLILIKNCSFWDCQYLARAGNNCSIYWGKGNNFYGKTKGRKKDGGSIISGDNVESKFWDEVNKMQKKSSNEW